MFVDYSILEVVEEEFGKENMLKILICNMERIKRYLIRGVFLKD